MTFEVSKARFRELTEIMLPEIAYIIICFAIDDHELIKYIIDVAIKNGKSDKFNFDTILYQCNGNPSILIHATYTSREKEIVIYNDCYFVTLRPNGCFTKYEDKRYLEDQFLAIINICKSLIQDVFDIRNILIL